VGFVGELLAHHNYPQSGKPETVHFDIVSKRPTQEEAAKLISVPFEKKRRGIGEIIPGILGLLLAAGFGAGGSALGFSIIDSSHGISLLAGYFLAFVWPLAMFGACIIGAYYIFFRTAQKKNPEDALKWLYEEAFMGSGVLRFGDLDGTVNDLELIVPVSMGIDREAARKYIAECRDAMTRAMELTTKEARGERNGGWAEDVPIKEMKIDGIEEIYPGVVEIHATYSYKDRLTREVKKAGAKETEKLISAELELHITSVMIHAGEYWYPYDIFPAFTCRRELP
jgi:hypothetical protein